MGIQIVHHGDWLIRAEAVKAAFTNRFTARVTVAHLDEAETVFESKSVALPHPLSLYASESVAIDAALTHGKRLIEG